MDIKEAVSKIGWGKTVLFTGAGFSLGANSANGPFKTAGQIAKDLYNVCNVSEDYQDKSINRAAQWFQQKHSDNELILYLQNEFVVSSISDEQRFIGSLNWKRCYTINYDEILEKSYAENGRPLHPTTPSMSVKDCKISTSCLHINGAISRLNKDTIHSEFKLTNESYAIDYVKNTGWWEVLEDDIITCDSLIFVGCSLQSDMDLIRLINQVQYIKDKVFFIVAPGEPDINIMELERIGTALKIGVSGFVKLIQSVEPILPPSITTYSYFKKPRICKIKPNQKSIDFSNLVLKGNVNNEILQFSITNPEYYPYYVKRDAIGYVITKITEGHKNFIINADIGNGKTMFLQGLSYILYQQGYNIFLLENNAISSMSEAIDICNNAEGKIVFIVENYTDKIDLLAKAKQVNSEVIVVISERTSIYESNYLLLEKISNEPFINVNIDSLTDGEIAQLVKIIDANGLWRDKASWSFEKKCNQIIRQNKRHFGQVLLSLYNAEHITQEYAIIISAIKYRQDYYKALMYILIGNVLDFKLSVTDVINNLGLDALNSQIFQNNQYLREILDFTSNEISFKSSIFAQYILQNIINPNDVILCLVDIFKELHAKRELPKIKIQLKALVRYNNISKLISKQKGFNNSTYSFYERIGHYEYTRKNPLYWLQFAIARLADKDYNNAKYCFENAYAFSEETNFDTYQIDNHYARFLLEDAVTNGLSHNYMAVFKDAREKLMTKRRGDEYKYYNFRVAHLYLDYYNAFRSNLSPAEIGEFIRACIEMREGVINYINTPNVSNKKLVQETLDNLNKIINC